jgi:hypothetical protein
MGPATPEVLNGSEVRALDARYDSWLTLQQAADAIGVSTRQVQTLAATGKLRRLKRPVEGGSPIAIFDPGDVEREKEKRQRLQVIPAAAPESSQTQKQFVTPDLTQLLHLHAFADKIREMEQPKLNLTLDEAAAASGLPAAYLRQSVLSGALPAHRWGKRGQRIWIHRADLETFRGSRSEAAPVPSTSELAQPEWSTTFEALAHCGHCGAQVGNAADHVCGERKP